MKTFRTAGFLGALAGAALLLGDQAAAQQAQLTRIGLGLAYDGFRSTHERQVGSLYEDESTTFSVWLDQGTQYVFRGTCDRDCSDVDLELKRNGHVVESDFAADDVPEITVRPPRSGWYQVRVIMASCSIEPCGFAVGTFGR